MPYREEQKRRRSIRLPDYDYAQTGAYFVTICTYDRLCLLGEILGCEMALTRAGQVVLECWNDLANHYSHVETDEFIVMPNHVHGIIVLTDQQRKYPIPDNVGAGFNPDNVRAGFNPDNVGAGFNPDNVGAGFNPDNVGAGLKPAPTRRHPLSEIVRAFKTFSSRRINEHRGSPGVPVWQRNYYERVIRNEQELDSVRQYIVDNPAEWAEDAENPRNIRR